MGVPHRLILSKKKVSNRIIINFLQSERKGLSIFVFIVKQSYLNSVARVRGCSLDNVQSTC